MLVSQSYGISRPAAIATRCAMLRTRFMPLSASGTLAPIAPVLLLIPATPARDHAAYLQSLRVERDELRHDLATMKACAYDAQYFGNGPSFEEIEAAEERMRDLDEMLILDDETEVCCTAQRIDLAA